jgi:hypothetical protein
MSDHQSTSMGGPYREMRSILGWLKENPAPGATLLYLWVSIVGSIYERSLLQLFGINIFDFATSGDFLLAAFRQPLALAAAIGPVIVAAAQEFIRQKRAARDGPATGQTLWSRSSTLRFGVWVTAVSAYTYGAPFALAHHEAWKVFAGCGNHVHVELSRADSLVTLPDSSTTLLGTTSEFLFLYRHDTGQSYVVPRSSLWQLRVRYLPGPIRKDIVSTCPP